MHYSLLVCTISPRRLISQRLARFLQRRFGGLQRRVGRQNRRRVAPLERRFPHHVRLFFRFDGPFHAVVENGGKSTPDLMLI